MDQFETGVVPPSEIPKSNADPKKRLMRCSLSGTTLATVSTNAPRMAIGSGQVKILRSWIYNLQACWDFRDWLAAIAWLEIRVNGVMVVTKYYENYYTWAARFINPIARKRFLNEGDIVTVYANLGSTNGWNTFLDVFEENDEKI